MISPPVPGHPPFVGQNITLYFTLFMRCIKFHKV